MCLGGFLEKQPRKHACLRGWRCRLAPPAQTLHLAGGLLRAMLPGAVVGLDGEPIRGLIYQWAVARNWRSVMFTGT